MVRIKFKQYFTMLLISSVNYIKLYLDTNPWDQKLILRSDLVTLYIPFYKGFLIGIKLKLFNLEIPVKYMSRVRFMGVISTTN